jgi:hypothetical protein
MFTYMFKPLSGNEANLKLQIHFLCKTYKGFSRATFKLNTDFIQFLFSVQLAF